MNLAEFSIKRPVGITMIISIIVIFGFVSLTHLPIDLMPEITYPTITISSSYSNASPTEIETLITRPIEQALAAVPGVEEINSTSSEGSSRVRVSFTWGIDLEEASNDIRDRLDRILSRLPEDVNRPTLRKFDAAATPILILGASSDLDPVQMLTLIEEQVKYRIERVPGIASLDVMGGRNREIQVNLDVHRLKAFRIEPEQVISRLKLENITLPAGMVESENFEIRLRTPGEFNSVEEINSLVIGEVQGRLVRLSDVAQVVDRWERARSIIRIQGKSGVRIMVYKQSGANTVEVANAVVEEVKRINQDLPQLGLSPIIDSSKFIKRSIDNVSSSAMYGGLLAIIILQFFLANLASTMIIAVAIPVSIIATFVLMYYFEFTLNIMSLGGVALGIGMLVDNSIVVLENIFRYRTLGLTMREAAVKGSDEVAMPVVASTLTTVVIFLPLLFVEGMTGIMFKQLAYVVSFSLVCSLFVSLTMVPMLSSKFLVIKEGKKSWFAKLTDAFVGLIVNSHSVVLDFFLKHKKTVFFLLGALTMLSILSLRLIGTELMPVADEGEVRVSIELEQGTTLSTVEKVFLQAEKIVMDTVPELQTIILNVGGGFRSTGVNSGNIRIPLVSPEQRDRSTAEVCAALRKSLSVLPGCKVRVREGSGMFMMRMGSGDGERLQVQIRGYDLDTADQLASLVQKAILEIDGVTDVQLSREVGMPEKLIVIDRLRAADQKLRVSQVASFLETMISGKTAGYFREGGDEYKILVRAIDAEFMTLEEILDLQIKNSEGKQVMLRNVARIEDRVGPTIIERRDQERTMNVSANIEGRPLGFVIEEAQAKIKEIPTPANFAIVFSGDYEEQQKSYRELAFSFVLAIMLVYMVMAIQYESLYDPIIVMTTVPLSLIGVVFVLLFTDTTLNIQSFIGCIMLGGIVVNNSILLVDHINDLRREKNVPLLKAVKEAASDRCRPILMTALTTILGLLPLAIGIGEGGEVQAPMARAVIGGLIFSTIISLLIIPILYIEFEKSFRRIKE